MTDKRTNPLQQFQRSGTELAPGVWSDPISQSRHDYGGELAAFENAMLQIKATGDAMAGSVDNVFDIAMELAATIAETHPHIEHENANTMRAMIARSIRSQKKVR